MVESKKERFVRVAERRTNAILEKLRVLGNCSNQSMYEYSDEEISKIFSAIRRAVKDTESQFKQKSNTKFKLK
jgi:hypothetical protein